jgi:two-component system chemotaxis response regulator CheB
LRVNNRQRSGPINVLIVEGSPVLRSALAQYLSEVQGINVVGSAKDAYEARELIIACRPDVIVLDVDIPRIDSLTFLKKLMVHYPVPVIMCAEAGPAGARTALEAMEIGAVDVVAKPDRRSRSVLQALGEDLAEKIRTASVSMKVPPPIPASATVRPRSFRSMGLDPRRYVVAIGASTGGTEAVRKLFGQLPADFPPVVIVQHMPPGFTRSFAARLDQLSSITVSEAEEGDTLLPGRAFLGRGGVQMTVESEEGRRVIRCGSDKPYNLHCPSVCVLFNSVAVAVGRQAVGIIMTGMGSDGAQGLLEMRRRGALTVGQERRSCVVYGMPKVAKELGAVMVEARPAAIPRLVMERLRRRDVEHVSSGVSC